MGQAPPAAPAAPAAPVALGTLIRLANEADAAFTAKDYPTAIAKMEELLRGAGAASKEPALETYYFHIGLCYLLSDKYPEAETAFTNCVVRYPKGEFTSRCYLGVGRACVLQGTPEKKTRAIEALKLASKDPKFRSEAGLALGQVYLDLNRDAEAMAVFKSLMGSDIRSFTQTSAAVQVLDLMADSGKLDDLLAYLDRLGNQAGIRDMFAWYAKNLIICGDQLVTSQAYDAALAIYRSVPPRNQILEIQKAALESQRKDVAILEKNVQAESAKPPNQRSGAAEYLGNLKPAIAMAEEALAFIEKKTDFDAAMLMRRGRCLYNLNRFEEALVCFRTMRTKYETAEDTKHAAYAEIVILSQLKKVQEIKILCEAYLRKYPDSDKAEQIGGLAGQVLLESGNWAEVGKFYAGLEAKFPTSEKLDVYTYYQGLAHMQQGDFKDAMPFFTKFLKNFPNSEQAEKVYYFIATANFLQGKDKYKETLKACKEYLSKFPDGQFAGDIRYRLAFIDFNDKGTDPDPKAVAEYENKMCDKIIRDLTSFLDDHPKDSSRGSMLSLLGDTYKKKTSEKADELAKFEQLAIESYTKAVWSESLDDVTQYALDTVTSLLQGKKDWATIAALHGEFLQKYPDSPMALLSANWVAKAKSREGKPEEAVAILANALKPRIGNPTAEHVESLIDELVNVLKPKKKPKDINLDEVDKQLVDALDKVVGDQGNPTTSARIYYARARLAQLLRRGDQAELYLKGIAASNAQKPEVLSPTLLSVCGDILLKKGDLDAAEAMFKRLIDRHRDGNFADAGPLGLGNVALARKKPDEALKIFTDSLENNAGTSRFKETTLGKLEALIEVGKLDEAMKLADEIIGDKQFRGEMAGKGLLLKGKILRKQAAKASGDQKNEFLKQADGVYKKVAIAYQSNPDVCAEGYSQDIEVLRELGETEKAEEMLKALRENPKLKNTEPAKKAK